MASKGDIPLEEASGQEARPQLEAGFPATPLGTRITRSTYNAREFPDADAAFDAIPADGQRERYLVQRIGVPKFYRFVIAVERLDFHGGWELFGWVAEAAQ